MSYDCPTCGCKLLKKPWTFERFKDAVGFALIWFSLGALGFRWLTETFFA